MPLGFLFAVYRHVGTNIPRNADGGASEYDNVCFTSFVVSPSPASVYPIVRSSCVLDCIVFISLFFMALRGKEIRISERNAKQKDFFCLKIVSQGLQSHFSPDKPFCGRVDASIFLLSLIRSLGLRPSLLTLGRVDASIFLLSLIRSLDEVHHLLARHAD